MLNYFKNLYIYCFLSFFLSDFLILNKRYSVNMRMQRANQRAAFEPVERAVRGENQSQSRCEENAVS